MALKLPGKSRWAAGRAGLVVAFSLLCHAGEVSQRCRSSVQYSYRSCYGLVEDNTGQSCLCWERGLFSPQAWQGCVLLCGLGCYCTWINTTVGPHYPDCYLEIKRIKAGEHKKLKKRPALDLRNIFQQTHKKIREFTQA